jgi:choline-sulfatase
MSVGMREGFRVREISATEMMKARAAYFACVSYLDEILGDLLIRMEGAGALDDTIIIYTSDHGEMAGEHGVWWKQGWYEACTRVPLIFSLPQHREGTMMSRTRKTPVALVDLFPTICSLAGVTYPGDLDGVDLAASITGDGFPPDRPIVCDNLMPRWGKGTEFRMVRQGSYKYVRFRDAPTLMFDLANDPLEQVDLCRNTPKSAQEARDRLRRFAEGSMDFDVAQRERLERDAELERHYALNLPDSTGNLYLMPTGRLLNAEDMLYHPTVICENADDVLLQPLHCRQKEQEHLHSRR